MKIGGLAFTWHYREPTFFAVYLCCFRYIFAIWQVHPDEVQLLVAVVHYKTKLVKPRRGLCSTWLASLDSSNKDLRVPVWIKKGTISFPKALDAPCLMIGPGICNTLLFYKNVVFSGPGWICLFFCRFLAEIILVLFLNYSLWHFRCRIYWGINYSSCRFFGLVGKFCLLENGIKWEHIIVLYLPFLNTQNYVLFKTSAWGLFLKYS